LFYGQSLWQVASASLHYTPGLRFVLFPFVLFRSLSVTTFAFPNPISGTPCNNVYPEKPEVPKFSECPNGINEVKEYGRVGEHVLENAGFEA